MNPAAYIPGPPPPPPGAMNPAAYIPGPPAVFSPPVQLPTSSDKKKGKNFGREPSPLRIAGVTGYNAGLVNGLYEQTKEKCGKTMQPKYVKVGDTKQSLQFEKGSLHGGFWYCIRTYTDDITVNCAGNGPIKQGKGTAKHHDDLPEHCSVGKWEITEGTVMTQQASVTISIVSQTEVEAYRVWAAAEAARVIIGTRHVRLVGVGEFKDMKKNLFEGVFEPTKEQSDGVTAYHSLQSDMWLMYHAATGEWQIRPPETKFGNLAYARCPVPAKCLPEECPVGQWRRVTPTRKEVEVGMYRLAMEPTWVMEIVSPQEAEVLALQVVAKAVNISIASPPHTLGPRMDVEPLYLYLRKDGKYSPGVFYERMFQLLNMEEVEMAADFEFVKNQVLARLKRYTDVVKGMMKDGTKGVKVRLY